MNTKIFITFFIFCVSFVHCYFPLVNQTKSPQISRSFTIDYKNNCFLKDGEPFRYVSGSIHYFRVPWQYWKDRIYKMKMAGLNAIQTYIEWNHHEPEPGVYNFEGNYDLANFLQVAHDLDMLVILRPGPFIDAERDMGGLPYWLLRINPAMKLRSYDIDYIKHVNRWYNVLLDVIEPFLYANGGPIITFQIENEYGSTGTCDPHYKSHLRDFVKKKLKNRVALFTTDGNAASALTCGKTDEVLSTVDFGSGTNVSHTFELLRWHQASGPLVNSEYYPGWLDHWGAPHATRNASAIVKTLTEMLQFNASVNIYMFHGGTSFGFTAGSNIGSMYQACPTSYDYDAPLTEAGDPTPKYYAMREAIGQFLPLPPGPVPKPSPKMRTKPISMSKVASLWQYSSSFHNFVQATNPKSFEDLYQPFGFVVYKTTVNFQTSDPSVLQIDDLRDRGYVYINKILQGILSREQKIYSLPVRVAKGEDIVILVENQGRVCSGNQINDIKGIFRNVTLGSKQLLNWTMEPITLNASLSEMLQQAEGHSRHNQLTVPAFYSGQFLLSGNAIRDTFLRVDGWHRGVAFLNGFNLGRYWPIVGPQITLYAPAILFKPKPAVNIITLLELENAPCFDSNSCVVIFVDTPVINGTVPENVAKKKKKH